MNSCFFIGHREADQDLLPRLESEIDRLIRSENVRYFYVGGYGGFDQIAATAVKRANRIMVDTCDWLVCFVRHGASNSRNLLEYAQRREKKCLIQIKNIAEGMGANL